MALTYGLDGIRQRTYKVWLVYPTAGNTGNMPGSLIEYIDIIAGNIEKHLYGTAMISLADLISGNADLAEYSQKLGECRKDSISLLAEDGDTVDGNEVGTIVLGKNCSFSCELINATPENINSLYSDVENQTPFYVILEEVSGRNMTWPTGEEAPNDTIESTDTHEIIFVGINNALFANIAENHIGGGISTITLSASDTVSKVNDFRKIIDIPYDLENFA